MPTGSISEELAVLLLLYLRGSYTSRRTVAEELGLGEGRARRILARLAGEGLVETVRSGSRITGGGRRAVQGFLSSHGVLDADVFRGCSELCVDCRDAVCAAFHGRGLDVWTRAVELRDCAVRGGALGALILVAGAEGFLLPPGGERAEDYLPRLAAELGRRFHVIGGDVVFAPFSERLGGAVRGFLSMLGCLSRART